MLQFVFFPLYIFCVFLSLMFRTDEGNGAILESEAAVEQPE